MREYELEPEARVRTRKVSRSVLDDIGTWWNGPQNLRERHEEPEAAYTKQDFDQTMSLVYMPVNLSHLDVFGKQPDAAACKAAAARLGPAASALQVIAGGKRDAKHQAGILAPLPDIQAAQTTLQVMGDKAHAADIWHDAFQTAMSTLDAAMALPVIDPDAVKDADNADPPPADGVMKRDHDLLEASVKPALQRLVQTTSVTPFSSWDPRTYTEGSEALAALGAVSVPKLRPAIDAVTRGVQAITTYAKDFDAQIAEASGKLEAAMQKLSASQSAYAEAAAAEAPQ
jgi:hypothetical protein